MTDQIVVLKNTKTGFQIDTVYNSNDTLFLDLSNKTTIEIPGGRLEVNTYPPPKDVWDVVMISATIIGVVAACWAAYSAYKQLKKENIESRQQIDHLAKLREIDEKRLKLMVKPKLDTRGRRHAGGTDLGFNVINEGNSCRVESIDLVEGSNVVNLRGLNRTLELKKGASIEFAGSTKGGQHPTAISFTLRLKYSDEGEYQYESYVRWRNESLSIETNEL